MKDVLLTRLTNSWKFKKMTKQEQMVELQDYSFQKRNFNPSRSQS